MIDYTTPDGQVRLLIGDVDEANLILSDEQISGFLTIAGDNVKRAAAAALDAIASSEALVSKAIRTQDLTTDGAKVAEALRKHAAQLRAEADQVDAESGFFFDIVPGPLSGVELAEHPLSWWA